MTTRLYSHPIFLEHVTPPGHPERPDRLRAIAKVLAHDAFDALDRVDAPPGDSTTLLYAHPREYIDRVYKTNPVEGMARIDADTSMSPKSWEAALTAVGAANAAVDDVFEGRADNVFVASRPPGHHAERNRAMGFCLFNNAAIAARHAQKKHGAERVAIVDWDVHHGNGTQALVEDEPRIHFVSMHQWPWYPGTGAADDRGPHDTVWNVPMPPSLEPARYREALLQAIDRATEGFTPDLVILSAGFDCLEGDPLGAFTLTLDDVHLLTRALVERAEGWCGGRLVSALEGGYAPDPVAQAVMVHVEALL